MSMKNFYAAAGLTLGALLGFLTRDDYLNSFHRKIEAMRSEYDQNLRELDTKISAEQQNNDQLTLRVEELRKQYHNEKEKEEMADQPT